MGRDPTEITCSSHLRIDPHPDPEEVAARAASMFDAGVDLVILGLSDSHDGRTVEALAGPLVDMN